MLAELRAVYLCIWQGLFIFMEHLNSSTYKAGFLSGQQVYKTLQNSFYGVFEILQAELFVDNLSFLFDVSVRDYLPQNRITNFLETCDHGLLAGHISIYLLVPSQ